MALNFGTLDFNVAFNPTYAFPLDARCYFVSHAAAEAAAAEAIAAGGAESKYYWGQNIVVVENNVASFFIIQPDGTLGEVGSKIEVDPKCFETNEEGKLSLLGFADAVEGAQLVINADGEVSWVKPDTTTVEGLSTAVKNLEEAIKNIYTKTETDEAIATAVSNAAHLKRKVMESVDAVEQFAQENPTTFDQYIFMVPTGLVAEDDKYDEYIVISETVIDEDDVETITYTVEKIGSWEVNLEAYAKTEDVNKALEGKVDVDENARLITNEEAEKLAGLQNAPFKTLSEDFEVVDDELRLKGLEVADIANLQDLLDSKAEAVEGERFITDEEAAKLEGIEEGAEANYIKSVSTSFEVDENGQLVLKAVPTTIDLSGNQTISPLITSITNLENLVNGTDEATGLVNRTAQLETKTGELETAVGNINELLDGLSENYVTQTTYSTEVGDLTKLNRVSGIENSTLVDEINDINTRLVWGEL